MKTCGRASWGSNHSERGEQPHHGDKGGLLFKTFTETDEDDVDELMVFH
jgi:hypothetical protein